MRIEYRRIVVGVTAAAWRTASEDFRSGFLAGVRACESGTIRLYSTDGAVLAELS